jgi:hypothetical protein
MIDTSTPLPELETAHELAEKPMQDHMHLMSDELASLLSTFHSDLTMNIDDRYGVTDDDEQNDGANLETS